MKATEFPTYEDANDGKRIEFGLASYIADKILRDVKTWQANAGPAIVKLAVQGLVRYLAENMLKFPEEGVLLNISKFRDPTLRGWHLYFVTDGLKYARPVEYVAKAYESWMIINAELQGWQRKSLWQYLSYWFRRDVMNPIKGMVKNGEN